MSGPRLGTWIALLIALAPAAVSAQAPGPTVSGIVFDSVRGAPLANATVWLGSDDAAQSDGRGFFAFADVSAGQYQLAVTHDRVPSWAFDTPLTVDVDAADVTDLLLATHALRTLEGRYCEPGEQLGSVVVRDLMTQLPLPVADVFVQGPRDARSTHRTSDQGETPLCTSGFGVTVTAAFGGTNSRGRQLVADTPLPHIDLYIAATPPSRIEGSVIDAASGAPVEGVMVGVTAARGRALTDSDGRFVLAGIVPGEVSLYAEHIGYGRAEGQVLVQVSDTVEVEIELTTTPVEIAPLTVTVRGSAADDRIRSGTRYDGLSRVEIDALLPRVTNFAQLLRQAHVPGLSVENVSLIGDANVGVPGICIEISRRRSRADDRACRNMVDVYVNGVRLGSPETSLQDIVPSTIDDVRLLSPLEAGVQYGGGRRGRNGVLLIRTR